MGKRITLNVTIGISAGAGAKKYLTEPRGRVTERVSDGVMSQLSLRRQAGVSQVKKRRAGFLARGHDWPFQIALSRLGPFLICTGEI